jgi:hypothetical protein
MKFFVVKVPKNNEYTYEQSLALFSSLIGKSKSSSIIKVFKKKSASFYSFNILTTKQLIYFIVGTNDENAEQLKNQILAQYPDADLISTQPIIYKSDYFTELKLAKKELFPIKTMKDFQDVDPLSSILSSIARSTDLNTVFWIQIILEAANKNWMKNASYAVNKMTSKVDKEGRSVPLTEQEKQQMQLIHDKVAVNGFTAYIRLVADNEANLNILKNSFNIFSQTFGNSFTAKSPRTLGKKKLIQHINEHKPHGKGKVLNALELASIWHLPTAQVNIPNIVWGKKLVLDPPENLPIATEQTTEESKKDITYFGKTDFKNQETTFGIKENDRFKHIYIIGKTGTGKSWLLANMAIEDIRKDRGVAILDPHGDLSEIILKYIPKKRINDICYFNPADPEYSYPLNILDISNTEQKELMVSGIISIFYKLYSHSWGPRLEHILRNVLFTLVNLKQATLSDVLNILQNEKFRQKVLSQIEDQHILQFWTDEYAKMPERQKQEAISPIVNKVGQFVTSPLIRKVIVVAKSKVRIEKIMNEGKILICDLSQGKIGEDNSTLLGSMIITQMQIAAMNRAHLVEEQRKPFFLYVDEFQNFATNSFIKILSEARKYKLSLTLANQYINQIDREVLNAILGNVGSLVCFNLGASDTDILGKEFGHEVIPEDLTSLNKYQMLMRLSIDNQTSKTFQGYSLPLPKNVSGHTEKIIENSRAKYGKKL